MNFLKRCLEIFLNSCFGGLTPDHRLTLSLMVLACLVGGLIYFNCVIGALEESEHACDEVLQLRMHTIYKVEFRGDAMHRWFGIGLGAAAATPACSLVSVTLICPRTCHMKCTNLSEKPPCVWKILYVCVYIYIFFLRELHVLAVGSMQPKLPLRKIGFVRWRIQKFDLVAIHGGGCIFRDRNQIGDHCTAAIWSKGGQCGLRTAFHQSVSCEISALSEFDCCWDMDEPVQE